MASYKKRVPRKFSLKALSFFSGALGLDLGLEAAGVEIRCASEIDPSTRETIKANKPDLPLLGDILSYSASDVLEVSQLRRGEVDLVVGGPPCQAFSSAGKRKGFEDARGNVFLAYLELAFELEPRYVVVENVRGLLSAPLRHRPHQLRGSGNPELTPEERPGGALQHILERFKQAGYGVSFNLYNSANFGVPQIRERVILIASRNGERLPYLTPTHSEERTDGLQLWTTFRQATEGLPPQPRDYVEFPEKRLKYYRLLREGQYWKDLPANLQKEALGKSYFAGGGKTGFFRRLAWDKPSPTLVTHPAMPATDLCHPDEDRPLSVQEYKRVQQFPDDWKLCGSILDQYRQIGNAVPVGLGAAVGRHLIAHTKGAKIEQFIGFKYSRYKGTSDRDWFSQPVGGVPQRSLFAST